MSSLLASIARSLATHWKRGLAGLVLTIVVVGAIIGSQSGSAPQDFSIPGTESQKAIDLLEAKFPPGGGRIEPGRLHDGLGHAERSRAARRRWRSRSQALQKLPDVSGVPDPLAEGGAVSKDGRTAFTTVQYDTPVDRHGDRRTARRFEKAARAGEGGGVSVELRGEVADLAAQQDAPVGELVGVAIAIVLLTLLFRSLAAMFVTLIGALVGVVAQPADPAARSPGPIGIPDFATTIAMMLGLGAGIDYALLIFSRFREQLAAGDTAPEAAARANATSGTSVVAAGLIVMVAIAGLLAVGIPLIGKMGVGSAIAVAVVVVSSITVLPIFAGALAKRLQPKDPAHVARSERFERWGRRIVRRPGVPRRSGGIAAHHPRRSRSRACASASPTTATRRRTTPSAGLRRAQPTAFGPGFNGPLLLAIDNQDGGALDKAQLDAPRRRRSRTAPGVASVAPASLNDAGDAAIITGDADDLAAGRRDVRPRRPAARRRRSPRRPRAAALNVYVGGQTAGFEDFSDKISSRLPLFIAIVIGLSILLLMAVFRSIWVPLASAVFNLLSIGAAYGVIVAVFQWGWGASLLGVDERHADHLVRPADDVRDPVRAARWTTTSSCSRGSGRRTSRATAPKESVVHGLSRIAKVILVAGLIMAVGVPGVHLRRRRDHQDVRPRPGRRDPHRRAHRAHGRLAGAHGAARRPGVVDPAAGSTACCRTSRSRAATTTAPSASASGRRWLRSG